MTLPETLINDAKKEGHFVHSDGTISNYWLDLDEFNSLLLSYKEDVKNIFKRKLRTIIEADKIDMIIFTVRYRRDICPEYCLYSLDSIVRESLSGINDKIAYSYLEESGEHEPKMDGKHNALCIVGISKHRKIKKILIEAAERKSYEVKKILWVVNWKTSRWGKVSTDNSESVTEDWLIDVSLDNNLKLHIKPNIEPQNLKERFYESILSPIMKNLIVPSINTGIIWTIAALVWGIAYAILSSLKDYPHSMRDSFLIVIIFLFFAAFVYEKIEKFKLKIGISK